MNIETFDTVVDLYLRWEELKEVKKCIETKSEHKLTYAYKNCDGKYEKTCSEYTMRYIANMLDKHDLAIRQEIDNEIEQIKKKIAEL